MKRPTLTTVFAIFSVGALLAGGVVFAETVQAEGTGILVRLDDQFLSMKTFAIPSDGKAILVDLNTMALTLYENGNATGTFPILSKGRKGTPWETPSGVYGVLLKKKNHFSSLGHVYMPWSMQFYGNFFIHGWPYDLEGNDVPRGYSGGCVRLSTSDAETVYHFVDRGTPIIVLTKPSDTLSGGYYLKEGTLPPPVTARSFLALDLNRGQLLWKHEEQLPVRDALSTKFLASLASLESMNQYTMHALPKRAPKEAPWLSERTELPAKDLIPPLMYSSGTSVESFLASVFGAKNFLRAMNEKALALGMADTNIRDLGGEETENMTTVLDMAFLLRGLDHSKRYLLSLTSASVHSLPGEHEEVPVVLLNEFAVPPTGERLVGGLADEHSGNALAVFELPVGDGSRTIAIAMAKSDTIAEDLNTMVLYLTSALRFVPETTESVILTEPVSFFSKLRMIWNRKRAGEILLGEDSGRTDERLGLLSI